MAPSRRRVLLAALGLPALGAAGPLAAEELPAFSRIDKLQGAVSATGSSTVAALLKPLADQFETLQPDIRLDIVGGGSSTALAGMLESPTTLGLLSRPMNAREHERLQAKYGHAPTELKVAVDAVGIYVFKSNPLGSLTLAQLRRAFGRGADAVERWGQLGAAAGDWADQLLVRYGLEPGRGAHDLFRDLVLQGGEFMADVRIEPVSTSVVQGVATQPGGIGYASVYFRTPRTRLLPIERDGEPIEPTADNVSSARYPLARFLYVVVNKPPTAPLEPATRQFLAYVLSRDGQAVVARQGVFPLGAALAREGLARLGAPGANPPPSAR
jgi:phosphate transport system substrate-binding protein